jgi:hypothetical protein
VNFFKFIYWLIHDIREAARNKLTRRFGEYGLTMFCGRQGGGKTVSLVEYLERMRLKYPRCEIYTNFGYENQTASLEGWQMLLDRRSDSGVIFAIDEIHSEFSSNAWKDFPVELLREISQQRKQQVKIVATAQKYKDVAVQLRRQCFNVVECRTVGGRWTFQRCFDAEDYDSYVESNATAERKFKVPRKWRRNFVQTDALRGLYDTYEKIKAMRRVGFQTRQVAS